jgi:hypothetical protein
MKAGQSEMRRERTIGGTWPVALALCLGASVSAIGATPTELLPAVADPPVVEVRGDTVYYTGGFKEATSGVFEAAVSGIRRGQVTRLVVRSGGGDTVAGRKVGSWVRDMGLVVEVDQICFSSCADYVFPAGRARVIRAGAFVGWHGNERQMQILAARQGTTPEQVFVKLLPAGLSDGDPERARAIVAPLVKRWREVSLPDEQAFYQALGLSDAFAVCAVGEVLDSRSTPLTRGWGFSITDMARLGMANTVYLGDGVYEKDSALFRKYLVPITADECLALMK